MHMEISANASAHGRQSHSLSVARPTPELEQRPVSTSPEPRPPSSASVQLHHPTTRLPPPSSRNALLHTDPESPGQDPSGQVVRPLQRRPEDQAQGRGPPPRRPPRPKVPVQLRRVPQQQDRLPPLRGALLLRLRRHQRQRARLPRGHPLLRRGPRRLLRQRLRARPRLQLLQGLRHPRRGLPRWRDRGDEQAGRPDEVGAPGQAGVIDHPDAMAIAHKNTHLL